MRGPVRGFTLIELIVVIGIIGLLAGAVLVAVSPARRFQETRDARRAEEADGLVSAMLHKQSDDVANYDGDAAAPIDADTLTAQVIVRTVAGVDCTIAPLAPTCPGAALAGLTISNSTQFSCIAQLDDGTVNSTGLVDKYVAELPIDPLGSGADPSPSVTDLPIGENNTGYYVNRTDTNRVEVGACFPDGGAKIRVKR